MLRQDLGCRIFAVSADSYDFGNVKVKQTSAPATFTIKNNGTGNLKITKMKIIGTDAKMFKIKGNCTKAIVPGGSCPVDSYLQTKIYRFEDCNSADHFK